MEKPTQSRSGSYKFAQLFGYKGPNEKIMEEDIISVMKFDKSGKFLALGDKAGRVIIFESPDSSKKKDEYDYFSEFQSHTREFDPLRSMDIEEEIKDIHWLSPQGPYMKMITTNDRSVKLWKIFDKTEKRVVKSAGKELNMPKMHTVEQGYVSQLQKQFPPKHLSSINSISSSANEEYLLTTDDVHAYLWNYDSIDRPFLVADILKNDKIEDIKETITFSRMHPTSDSLFTYGTNKGTLKLCDMRVSALTDSTAISFKNEISGQKNFLTEMISCYSSGDFSRNTKYLITRDFLTVKIWDICNAKKPLSAIVIQEGMKGKLCEMFENDCIFDKFAISASLDSNTIFTGNYNNSFHLIDADGTNTQYELNFKKTTVSRAMTAGKGGAISKMDYTRKVLAGDFNPRKNMVAVAALNCFYVYSM